MFLQAQRCPPQPLPKPTSESAKQGLRYERALVKALQKQGHQLEHNPWFVYNDHGMIQHCCPDILVYQHDSPEVFVVEVKLTYTPEAARKLIDTYCPIVAAATGWRVVPVIVYRNATPQALSCPYVSLQWRGGRNPLLWKEWLAPQFLPLMKSNPGWSGPVSVC
jgi:hypothetical protein